ncbi:MAG TPA: polysaccharide deacetylase family protein [Gemmatimonadales bacterium]|nr:polysaccharide deacetylase family protein [Gemmatimonadales bacterium]
MHRARLLIFWDYDTQWGTDADRRRGLPVQDQAGGAEYQCTERLLELHAEYGAPACFAVVAAAALPGARPYHNPAQVRRLHADGHEVASHGFRHEWIPELDLRALRNMLEQSKRALEDCIGHRVTSFVPPYNQPFDYPSGLSFSRSERQAVPHDRTGLGRLCEALHETGYDFCRVAYRSLGERALDRLMGRPMDRPSRLRRIGQVHCARLNTPCGFASATLAVVDRAVRTGGLVVAYGHPHSLQSSGAQAERWLVPFLEHVRQLRRAGQLDVVLPRDLTAGVGCS